MGTTGAVGATGTVATTAIVGTDAPTHAFTSCITSLDDEAHVPALKGSLWLPRTPSECASGERTWSVGGNVDVE